MFINIGILFGGRSYEHDISIISASSVYYALKDFHNIYPLYINKEGSLCITKEIDTKSFVNEKKFRHFEFINKGIKISYKKIKLDVIISCMHGINGEDGLAYSISNLYNIAYVGSPLIPSALCIDKYYTHLVLKNNQIKSLSSKCVFKKNGINNLSYPVIFKPARLGSSIGVIVIKNDEDLKNLLPKVFYYDDKVVIQKYYENFREYNQAIYRGKNGLVLSKVEEVIKGDEILSFDDKYIEKSSNKLFIDDEKIINKISEISKKIYEILELEGIVRIDYMHIDGEIYVNEINTTPGSLAYYLFNDSFINILEDLIYVAIRNKLNEKDTTFDSSILSLDYHYKK